MKKKHYIFGGIALASLVIGGIVGLVVYKTKHKSIWDDSEDENCDPSFTTPPVINPNVSPEVREALLKDWNRPSLLSPESEKKMGEVESPEDDEEEDIIQEEEEELLEEAAETHEVYSENKNKPPKIISANDLGSVPEGYEEIIWDYYKFDETIADEDMNEIKDY